MASAAPGPGPTSEPAQERPGQPAPRAMIPSKGVLKLAAPLVISFWFRSAFQWVDTVYASLIDGRGDESIAAIGLTLPFEFLMIACWVGASNALTSRLSAAMGAGQGARIEQLLASTRRLVIGLSVLFMALAAGIWFLTPLLGLDPILSEQFRIYGTVLLFGSSFTTFWSILPDSIVKAHHDTRSTMWAGLASTIVNVVLNTLFLFVFHWGIFGIALATVLGRLGGLAYALWKANQLEHARKAKGGFDDPSCFRRPLRALLALAIPGGMAFVLLALESFAFNGLLTNFADSAAGESASEGSTDAAAAVLAGWSILDRASRFLTMPIIAIGVAMLPLTARLWGAGDLARVRRELRTGLSAATAYTLLFVAPLALWLGPLVARSLTDSPAAEEAAVLGLRWLPLAVLFGAPVFLLRPTFEGMQLPRPGLIVSAVRSTLLVPPLGALGFWYGERVGLAAIEGLVLGLALGAGLASLLAFGLLGGVMRKEARA